MQFRTKERQNKMKLKRKFSFCLTMQTSSNQMVPLWIPWHLRSWCEEMQTKETRRCVFSSKILPNPHCKWIPIFHQNYLMPSVGPNGERQRERKKNAMLTWAKCLKSHLYSFERSLKSIISWYHLMLNYSTQTYTHTKRAEQWRVSPCETCSSSKVNRKKNTQKLLLHWLHSEKVLSLEVMWLCVSAHRIV